MRRALLLLISLVLLPAAVCRAQSTEDPWDAQKLDRAALEKALADTEQAAKTIPDSEKPETEAGRKKAMLNARAALISELLTAQQRQAAAAEARKQLPAAEVVKREVEALDAEPLPDRPAAPEIKEFERLQAERDAALAQQKARQTELEALDKRIAGVAERVAAARQRASAAKAAAETRAKELASIPTTQPAHGEKSEALRSVRLLARTAAESILAIEAEETADRATRPVLLQQIDLESKRVGRLEKQVARYQDMLRVLFESERAQRTRVRDEAKRAFERAETPGDRFLYGKKLAFAEKNLALATLNARKSKLSRLMSVQQAAKDLDSTQFENRLKLVVRTRNARAASDLLKKINTRIAARKQEIASLRDGDTLKELDDFLQLQLEIEDELLALEAPWEEQLEEAVNGLGVYEELTLRGDAAKLRKAYRKLLYEDLRPVFEQLRTDRVSFGLLLEQHEAILAATETKIRARFLWYRDAPVLGAEVFEQAAQELASFADRARSLHDTKAMQREVERRPLVETLGFAILFLLVLPAGLILLRLRLFRLHTRLLEAGGRAGAPRVRILLIGIVRAVLFPSYAYGLASLVAFAPLHAAPSTIARTALVLLGHALLVLGFTRVFVGRNGIALSLYGMMQDTAHTIRRAVVFLLLASLAFLLPWAVLRQEPPFGYLAAPRIAYTLFELCALVVLVMLMRRKSPFMRDLNQRTMSINARRLWRAVSVSSIVLGFASVALDILGHRFVAFEIAMRLAISLAAVFILVGLFITLVPRIDEVLRRRVGKLTAAPGDTSGTSAWEFGRQLRRFLSGLFMVVSVVVFARLWGLDKQALEALDHIPLYTVATNADGTAIVASAGDLAACLITIAITVWLLRYLSGIFELLLYPRVRWDAGLRYAVLSISRYTIAFVGVLMALGAIHMNLGRLGWLMAAVGVGLGFGMQEIVSNFVSGIILLVERPIRVGDIVTIGAVSGVVTKINIRATTVRNWDRLEVVLPNKDLITKEVTNWTLADATTRVTVKIGVAYGSDVEQVRRILHEIVDEQPEVLKEPEPMIIFMQHGESSLDFEVRIFLAQTAQRMPLTDRLNVLINRRLAENGIEIPFPQRDVHIRSEPGAREPSPPPAVITPEPEEPAPGAPTVEGMGASGAET